MRKLINILVFIILANAAIAIDIQGKSDSLLKLLENMPEDTNRVIVLNKLSSDHMYHFHTNKLSFIKEALFLSRNLNYTSGELISLERMARYHYDNSKSDSALYYLKLAEKLTLAINDQIYLTEIYANYSLVYMSLADYYKAINNAYKSFELANELVHQESIARALARLGLIYLRINKYKNSIEFTEQALKYHTELNNSVEIDVDHYFLAKAYTSLNDKKKAIFHFEKILEKHKGNKTSDISGNIFHVEGQVEALKGNYRRAMENYVNAINLMQKTGTQKRISEVSLNIIEVFVELLKNNQSIIEAERSITTLGYLDFEEFARTSYNTMKEIQGNQCAGFYITSSDGIQYPEPKHEKCLHPCQRIYIT